MKGKKEFVAGWVFDEEPIRANDAFSRADEGDDEIFYAKDRFVAHLDSLALGTVETIIDQLVVEESPTILDLMAGWDSHIPKRISPTRVVGLGLNKRELAKNEALTEIVLHDLNKNPTLPFPNQTFDIVVNTISVDYMTKPVEVFHEAGRILKPGGLFLVLFSNRMFMGKAVKVWRESSDEDRILIVEEFFARAGLFERPDVVVSKDKPRPKDDKYALLDIPSDPVYAVYADKLGGDPLRKKRPEVTIPYGEVLSEEELERRMKAVKETLQCPYCGQGLKKWEVPDSPFGQTWPNEFMYICFDDACPYFVRAWDFSYRQGQRGRAYRLMYHPEKDRCMPIPVPTRHALKESIIE